MANQKYSARNITAAFRAMADVSVLPVVNPGAPTSGVGGTLAGFAGPGCLLIDTVGAKLYINSGTKSTPTWTVVGTQT